MKCRELILSKLKKTTIILLTLIMCMTTMVFASEEPNIGNTEGAGEGTGETPQNLPQIRMKVETNKVGEGEDASKQVLVKYYASNFANLEEIDVVFTYNKTVIEPSYVSDIKENDTVVKKQNAVLSNLSNYKYDKSPEALKPSSEISEDEKNKFNEDSQKELSNSFEFDSAYSELLNIHKFRYLAPDDTGNIETLQFTIGNATGDDISSADEVLIGTFSFRQLGSTVVSDGFFGTERVKIIADDFYERGGANPGNPGEILQFVYQQYGSISGIVDASLDEFKSKHITTIKVYKASDVASVNWSSTGTNYINAVKGLPEPVAQYTTTAEDNGKFTVEQIECNDTYVVVVDKKHYGDYIITNVNVSLDNKDVDLLELLKEKGILKEDEKAIKIIPGDIDKNGKLDSNDTLAYSTDFKKGKNSEIDFNDTSARGRKNDSNDTLMYSRSFKQNSKGRKNIIKKVVNL